MLLDIASQHALRAGLREACVAYTASKKHTSALPRYSFRYVSVHTLHLTIEDSTQSLPFATAFSLPAFL